MPTKLTLRLDDQLINRAKHYAEQRGTSLSQMVADFFHALTVEDTPSPDPHNWKRNLPPLTQALVGSLAGSHLDEADYREYLEEKHR